MYTDIQKIFTIFLAKYLIQYKHLFTHALNDDYSNEQRQWRAIFMCHSQGKAKIFQNGRDEKIMIRSKEENQKIKIST